SSSTINSVGMASAQYTVLQCHYVRLHQHGAQELPFSVRTTQSLGSSGRDCSPRSFVCRADAIQVLQRPDEELPVRNRRRGTAFLVKLVAADDLALRARLEYPHLALVIEEVQVTARGHRRGAVVRTEALLPQPLTS